MRVEFFILAETVNRTEDGKLNIIGVYNQLNLLPDKFPAVYPNVSLALRVAYDESEIGIHEFNVTWQSVEGAKLGDMPIRPEFLAVPYKMGHMDIILKIDGLVVTGIGDYYLAVFHDGAEMARYDVYAREQVPSL